MGHYGVKEQQRCDTSLGALVLGGLSVVETGNFGYAGLLWGE